jgi:hypothetical protein
MTDRVRPCTDDSTAHSIPLSALVLAMWRCARHVAVPGAVSDDIAGVMRQPGATPAYRRLCRHKPVPRSSPSLWGSPQAVLPDLLREGEQCGPTSSR